MRAYDLYSRGYTEAAMFKYLLAAELGYEVAQSNVAYILDNGETDSYPTAEKYKRALMQWSRAAGQGKRVTVPSCTRLSTALYKNSEVRLYNDALLIYV